MVEFIGIGRYKHSLSMNATRGKVVDIVEKESTAIDNKKMEWLKHLQYSTMHRSVERPLLLEWTIAIHLLIQSMYMNTKSNSVYFSDRRQQQ